MSDRSKERRGEGGRRVQRKGKKKQTTPLMYEVMDEANSRATQIIGYHSDDDVFASADSFLLSPSSPSSSSPFDPYHIPFRLLLRFENSATASCRLIQSGNKHSRIDRSRNAFSFHARGGRQFEIFESADSLDTRLVARVHGNKTRGREAISSK